MIEVTESNFSSVYPTVKEAIENANFFSIDTEFTGIRTNEEIRDNLFDTMEERYQKLRENIKPFIIIQFGLSTFQRIPRQNKYKVQTFNFYILPRNTPVSNRHFMWQIAAVEFLSLHKFDFNKVAQDGISYLNEKEEAELKSQLKEYALLQNTERCISHNDEETIKQYSFQVSQWLKTSKVAKEPYILNTPTILLQYLLHKELRTRFNNIWTVSGEKCIVVMNVGPEVQEILSKEEGSNLEDELLDAYVGFSKVYKLLVKSQKTIIAHNCLLDFMFIHQQFYKPLPKKYNEFKKNIHTIFPKIYDTKCLSYEIVHELQGQDLWKSNSLNSLYDYFQDQKQQLFMDTQSYFDVDDKIISNDVAYHNAGWDSYVAGYVFVNLALFRTKKLEIGNIAHITSVEALDSLKYIRNCINIARGGPSYMKLDGPDPESTRPQWLYVTTTGSKNTLNMTKLTERLSSFGAVDVKPFTMQRALIAVGNYRSAREIMSHFKANKELYVVPYNPIRHSPYVRAALWSGVILTGGIFAWMAHRSFHKTFTENIRPPV